MTELEFNEEEINHMEDLFAGKINLGLSKIRLDNFKSISFEKPQEIDISPLTLLCGENSSGKSTLIHAILLMLQALGSNAEGSRQVELNGKLIQLNHFGNIIHDASSPGSMYEPMEYDPDDKGNHMNIGFNFNTLFNTSVKGRIGLPSSIKLDAKLGLIIPGLVENELGQVEDEIQAFPELLNFTVETNEVQETYQNINNPELEPKPYSIEATQLEKRSLHFRDLGVKNKSYLYHVDYSNDGSLSLKSDRFEKNAWLCDYQSIEILDGYLPKTSTERLEYENSFNRTSFGQVNLTGGFPSSVGKTQDFFSFISKHIVEQLKLLFNDEEFLQDTIFNYYYQPDYVPGKSEDRESFGEINEDQVKDSIIKSFTEIFELVPPREDPEANERSEKDILGNFAVNLNTFDFMPHFSESYNSLETFGRELIKYGWGRGEDFGHIFNFIFYNLTPRIVDNIISGKPELRKQGLSQIQDKIEGLREFKRGVETGEISYEDEEHWSKSNALEMVESQLEELEFEAHSLEEGINESSEIDESAIQVTPVLVYLKNILDSKFFIELEGKLYETLEKLKSVSPVELLVTIENETEEVEDTNWNLNNLRTLAKKVKYIGPLRRLDNNEPKIENFDDNIPMGVDGEYFFNYFHNVKDNKALSWDWISKEIRESGGLVEQESLKIKDEFNAYLKFFEIAEEFNTQYSNSDHSIVGHVKPKGLGRFIRMKELGVGFSQLAPIILLCITSEPGSTILLEQPELHLHPKVEQKFADFIVDMILNRDLQIILETHSDHILNRVRRKIAQAKMEENDTKLFEKCSIYFAEREGNSTEFRKAKLTNSGTYDLTDFPKGFFDQGAEDAFFILKASLEDEN